MSPEPRMHVDASELDIAGLITPGDTLAWGGMAGAPLTLLETLETQLDRLPRDCRVNLAMSLTNTPEARRMVGAGVHIRAVGGAGQNRHYQDLGALDVLPINYAVMPDFVRSGHLRADVVLAQLAADGSDFNLSVLTDHIADQIFAARTVIAEINDQAPVTFGETMVWRDQVHHTVHVSHPIAELRVPPPGDAERAIGAHVARLVPDGATVQVGIGTIPDAALASLSAKKDLGIHGGTLGDGVMDLIECGAASGRKKPVDTGLAISAGLLGTERVYRWAHRNRKLSMRSQRYTHDPALLATFPNLIGINAALEVDLTGQMNAEAAGGRSIGMIGGHADFMRACQRSPGGRGIVALLSTARGGKVSRIVPRLADGIVTTARAEADIVVTEYGIAELRGRTVRERADALINIAHPEFRDELRTHRDRLI